MTKALARRRVVIDTDAANEIDDQFAIAWALLSPEKLEIEGVHAAPFSHAAFLDALASASRRRGEPSSALDRIACAIPPAELAQLREQTPPHQGMARSAAEIERVFDACGVSPGKRVRRGAERFMPGPQDPVDSDAVRHLIELADTASAEDPLYVATIGAPTNVASALLLAPEICERVVVLFLAGFPSGSGLDDDSFNLVQDRHASNVLLRSPAPLVYLPGYHVAELIQLSWPDARAWLAGRGRLGDFLLGLYEGNPLNPARAEPGRSWILWDMIAIAWLLDSDWVPTREVRRAQIDEQHRWQPLPEPHCTMREAIRVDRNALFEDFFDKLGAFAERTAEA